MMLELQITNYRLQIFRKLEIIRFSKKSDLFEIYNFGFICNLQFRIYL